MEEPPPAPRKRQRSSSPADQLPPRPAPPAPAVLLHIPSPLASHFIHPPGRYTPPGAPGTPFQQPLHLTSFSYGTGRELLNDEETRDQALAIYREPKLGADLRTGYEEATWRKADVDEGLDALLDCLLALVDRDLTPASDDLLVKITVFTWRGMMTKLLLAVYEVENAARRGGGRADGWEMNAMLVDGALYLEDSNSPTKLAAKSASESSYKLQSYFGYSFEAFSTMPPSSHCSTSARNGLPPGFQPPNTNVQWCSVIKTNLGGFRTVLGGEVDCVLPREGLAEGQGKSVRPSDFVELKTNINIQTPRDEMMFERNKLLKHYTQSFLLGVPTITVGFRTREGELTGLQTFKTLEIPRLVRGKPHGWDPAALLASGHSLLSFIYKTLAAQPTNQKYETKLHAAVTAPSDPPSLDSSAPKHRLAEWPVFRVSFDPAAAAKGEPGVLIRELTAQEIERDVLGGKKDDKRIGFLLERWIEEARNRRQRVKARELSMASARPSAPPPPRPTQHSSKLMTGLQR